MKNAALWSALLFMLSIERAEADRIHAAAEDLKMLLDPGHEGRHGFQKVRSREPVQMVREFLVRQSGNPKLPARYRFVENARGIAVDARVAGTLVPVAADAALEAAGLARGGSSTAAQAAAILGRLQEESAVFGFDGFSRNACGQPTPYLLIIDQETGTVDGVDLNPCARPSSLSHES